MSSLILTAGNGTSRKATTACLGRRCRLKRNEAYRLRSPVLPTCPALMRLTALALGANSCGNVSWFETLARGTNAYCRQKDLGNVFRVPQFYFRVTDASRKTGKKNEKKQKRQKHLRGLETRTSSLAAPSLPAIRHAESRGGRGGDKVWNLGPWTLLILLALLNGVQVVPL